MTITASISGERIPVMVLSAFAMLAQDQISRYR
jgi:hypothetical protein